MLAASDIESSQWGRACRTATTKSEHYEWWERAMSKMACPCGGIISDTQVPSPTEGWILRCQDQEAYEAALARDIDSFYAAKDAGKRNEWLNTFFSTQYPTAMNDAAVVSDIIASHSLRRTLSIAECAKCGRLHVQHQPEVNAYRTFTPDVAGYAGVLRSH
jgi:hypothetical protein